MSDSAARERQQRMKTSSSDTTATYHHAILLSAIAVVVLVTTGVVLGAVVGWWWVGALVGLVAAAGVIVFAYFRGERVALRVGRAEPADPSAHARYHNLVEGLCVNAGLPKPDLYVVQDAAPNAFVAGRSGRRASIAVTTGLLERLSRIELEGVVAQLLSQLRSPQLLTSTMAVTLGGGIPMLADMGLRARWPAGGREPREGDPPAGTSAVAWAGTALLPLAALCAPLVRAAAPVRRVELADLAACRITRYPPGLTSALETLRDDTTVVASATMGTAHLWFVQPMPGVGDAGELAGAHRRFDTHPPLDERVALLREL